VDLVSLKKRTNILIDERRSRSIEMAGYIFDHPEVGGEEHTAKEYLVKELKENGFTVEEGVGGFDTSFRAEFMCKKGGPGVSFIAEYDALPGINHACHHHLIASASVNSAIAISKMKEALYGTIYCIGTPAEEVMNAKGIMWKNGAFDGVDVGLMVHGGSMNNTNLIVLAYDIIEFTFRGKAAHAAAAPYEGKNALDAVIMLFNSVNALRQQLKDDVRIHGIILHGGDAVNIIPEHATARYVIRAQKRTSLEEVLSKLKNCAKGAELQTGTKLDISYYEKAGNDLLLNTTLMHEYEKNLIDIGGTLTDGPVLLGSSDIGNLSYYIPVIHPMIKTADDNCALHTKEFLNYGKSDIAFEGMIAGMKSLAMTGVRLLTDRAFFNKVREEFETMKPDLTAG
jgi:amidohydrolase